MTYIRSTDILHKSESQAALIREVQCAGELGMASAPVIDEAARLVMTSPALFFDDTGMSYQQSADLACDLARHNLQMRQTIVANERRAKR
jgi:hypothetical protein